MKVNENEYDQAASLAKEAKCVLSLLHTRGNKNNKYQENAKPFISSYHIQDKKYMQHKRDNMSWDYRKFPRHPISTERLEIRGGNE